jgi:hypothetical protein
MSIPLLLVVVAAALVCATLNFWLARAVAHYLFGNLGDSDE